jgi:hypothetical protein
VSDQVIPGADLRRIVFRAHRWAYCPPIDKRYFLPSEDFARVQLLGAALRFQFRPEVADCDDAAIILLGRVREMQVTEKWAHPAAFGFAIGTLKDGRSHATNVAVTNKEEVIWLDQFRLDMDGFRPSLVVI